MSVRSVSTGLIAFVELASIIGIVGCASPRLRLDAEAEPPGTSFRRSYERWTRDGSVVSWQELDTTLLVSATLRSRSFQRAYIDRYLKLYRINDPTEQARIEKEELELAQSGVNFWVRSASHNPKWNELAPQKGRWRITLIDEQGHESTPELVTAITRTEGIETSLFGEYPDIYRRVWHIKFAPPGTTPVTKPAQATDQLLPDGAAPGTVSAPVETQATSPPLTQAPATENPGRRKLTLRFAGPEGKADLEWLVE